MSNEGGDGGCFRGELRSIGESGGVSGKRGELLFDEENESPGDDGGVGNFAGKY